MLQGLTVSEVNEQFQTKLTSKAQCSYCQHLVNNGYGQYVKKGNVFISHAWKFLFLDTYDTLKDYFSARPYVTLWFDLFSNNQHEAVDLDFSWWTNTFMSAIKNFGETVMVINPWYDPHPLRRAWCLYEIYSTVITGSKFSIALSKSDQKEFLAAIKSNPDAINKMLAAIHLESSEAFKPQDRDNIIKTVASTCGFNSLNNIVFQEIRKWLVNTVENEIKVTDVAADVLSLKTILADILRSQGHLKQAESLYLLVLKEWNKLNGPKSENSLAIMNRLGDVYYRLANGAESMKYYMMCLDEGYAISSTSETAISEMDYLNKIMDAIISCPCCYSLKYRNPKVEPNIDANSNVREIRSYFMLASLYYKQARRRKAEPMYIESIEALAKMLGETNEEVLVMKSNLASLYFYEGEYEKAENILNETYAQLKTQLSDDHPFTLLVLQNMAYYFLDRKRFSEAIDVYRTCSDRVIAKQGPYAQGVRKITLNLALSLYCSNQYSKSFAVLKDAIKLSERDVNMLLLNRQTPSDCSVLGLCVATGFKCLENTLFCCAPCHYTLSCCNCCNHVESVVGCSILTTCSCCACFLPATCIQTVFDKCTTQCRTK